MELHFTKMHGIGNDYIYFDCMHCMVPHPERLAVLMSPRHFSVGSDGVVLICPSDVADAKMRMFNADGSEGKMCGNAIRCVGKFLYDNHYTDRTDIEIETLSGIKKLTLMPGADGKIERVRVDMGRAILNGPDIPVALEGLVRRYPITVLGEEWEITAVSMGNPHAVVFVDEVKSLPLDEIGPAFEHHPLFPERINTEFVRVISQTELEMRVYERGSGETWACGTGACASVVAAAINGLVAFDSEVTVHLIGGDLSIVCTSDLQVFMTGPAAKAYEGVFTYDED